MLQPKTTAQTLCEPGQSKRMSVCHKSQYYTDICRKNAATQNHAADFVRACAVETHVKISQEPLYTEIYRKNAATQIHAADFVRVCAVETHVKMSQEPSCRNLQVKCRRAEWTPWSSTGLYTYRKNPSVWTHCLGNIRNSWISCFKCNPSLAHPFLFSHPSKHQHQSAFGNKFRGPVGHKRACATCQQRYCNKFRGPCLTVVKNLMRRPVGHKRARATCQQRQRVLWTLSYRRQESYQPPCWAKRNMCNKSTTAKKIVDPVLQSSRTLSTPLLSISEHGNMPRTATSFFNPVLQSSRTLSAPSVEHN